MAKYYTPTETELISFYQAYVMVQEMPYGDYDAHEEFAKLIGRDRQDAKHICYAIGQSLARTPVVAGFLRNRVE